MDGWTAGTFSLAAAEQRQKGALVPPPQKNSRGQKRKHSQDRENDPTVVLNERRRQSDMLSEQEKLWLVCVGVGVILHVVVSSFMLAPTGTANVLYFQNMTKMIFFIIVHHASLIPCVYS